MENESYNFAHVAASLVHAIQRERGFVAVYLKSKGEIFKQQLQQHFTQTDEVLQDFASYKIANNLPALADMRSQIMALEIADHLVLDFYTYKLINPLLQMMVKNLADNLSDCDKTVSVYNAFLQWKENLGLERALGTRALIEDLNNRQGAASYNEFTSRLNSLMQKEQSNKQICLLLANEQQKALLENLQNSQDNLLNDILNSIESQEDLSSLAEYDLTPQKWFYLIDEKMDILYSSEKQLIDIIQSKNESIEALEHLKSHWNFLKTLPLFKDMADDTIRDTIADAAVQACDKGDILFEQQELPLRFYIILEGWVKIASLSENGEEVVLQMLGAGDLIMEQAGVLNIPCPASAIAVKETKLLSVDIDKMRHSINNNPKLALNLLHVMASRSQSFMWHVEHMRSHNAEHRLAWFLLRLLLHSKADNSKVRLPYDKSLVASYLDMKPETLSRAFKKLKKQGVAVQGDTIIIPDFATLCEFCNQATIEQYQVSNGA